MICVTEKGPTNPIKQAYFDHQCCGPQGNLIIKTGRLENFMQLLLFNEALGFIL